MPTGNRGPADRLGGAAPKTVIPQGPLGFTNPADYEVRAEILWTGAMAHNDLFHTDGFTNWGSHITENEINGLCDVAHGAGLVVFPPWMKSVYKVDRNRFVLFAVRVWVVDPDFRESGKMTLEDCPVKGFLQESRAAGISWRVEHSGVPVGGNG